MVFNAGEWQAKLGDQQLRGYYSALLVRDGGEVKILEEIVKLPYPDNDEVKGTAEVGDSRGLPWRSSFVQLGRSRHSESRVA